MELAGFYFDEDKKKYYRILSGSNTPSCNFLTSDRALAQLKVKQRISDKSSILPNCHINQLINKRQINTTPFLQHKISYNIWKKCNWNYKCPKTLRILTFALNNEGKAAFIFEFCYKSNYAVALYLINEFCNFDFTDNITLKSLNENKNNLLIKLNKYVTRKDQICLVRMTFINNVLYILLILNSFRIAFSEDTIVIKMCLNSVGVFEELNNYKLFDYGYSISISISAHIAVTFISCIKLANEEFKEINKIKTDSKCTIDFFNQNKNILAVGELKTPIKLYDIRSNKSLKFNNNNSEKIYSLHVLNDDYNILTSQFDGKILLWDIRSMNYVFSYDSFRNERKKINLFINSNQEYFASVDEAIITRIWSIRESKIIHMIEPPSPLISEFYCKNPTHAFHPKYDQLILTTDNYNYALTSTFNNIVY